MFGVGATYTPTSLGTINLGFIFGVNISSDFMPTDDYVFSIRYGTGTPPSTSDPLTGTSIASQSYGTVANNQDGVTNMYLNAIASSLTIGVQYWFDVSITSTEAYPPTAKFTGTDITYSLFELTGGMGATGSSMIISGSPSNTSVSVGWGKVNIGGSDYWVPLYQ
jgi:hypothetical protein